MGINEIEKAISDLTPDDLARFRIWYEEFEAQTWDEQIEEDIRSGKLDEFAENALEEYHAGKFKDL
jgi:hypothetical protein